jgi:hypothetical protein
MCCGQLQVAALRGDEIQGGGMTGFSKFSVGLVALALATPLAAADSIQGSFERTCQVTGPVELEVLTHSGDVTVNSGPAGSVVIRGKIHVSHDWFSGNRQGDVNAIEKNPPIRQTGNSIISTI